LEEMTIVTGKPILTKLVDRLKVTVYADRMTLGEAAAEQVVKHIIELQEKQENIRMVFAAAPSQNEFLAALVHAEGIDWSRITAFHMDEYIGLPIEAPQRFSRYLRDRLFDLVKPGAVHLINSTNDVVKECIQYESLLKEDKIDIVCMGIGENGHIAFNDPPVADFDDPVWVKAVELDMPCRQQQVNDGCFSVIEAVPTLALTLTVPALMSGDRLFCIVPGSTKRPAVFEALQGPISTNCPASILRRHPDCTLYVDSDSYEPDKQS
jgi:glucosamine-6-phosphate deaminase